MLNPKSLYNDSSIHVYDSLYVVLAICGFGANANLNGSTQAVTYELNILIGSPNDISS